MEQELKFAVPAQDPAALEKRLRGVALLKSCTPTRRVLHNTYYDTPRHDLQARAVALRVRRIGPGTQPLWVQTLKTGGPAQSALSRRGEWEMPLAANTLDANLLQATPWTQWDPDGKLFDALVPVFTTHFERLSWIVHYRHARLEIALDRGAVEIGAHHTPLCELEIELLEGDATALFAAAEAIAQRVPLLPLHLSKAERAYRLAQGTLFAPLRAKPPELTRKQDFSAVARTVLAECLMQFTANLYGLQHSDAPELVHQARVGWRRFRSALSLLGLQGQASGLPALLPLKPLTRHLGALRDLQVVANDVLPALATAYHEQEPARVRQWRQLETRLQQRIEQQRHATRQTLLNPATGHTLLQLTGWLALQPMQPPARVNGLEQELSLSAWARKRLSRRARKMAALPANTQDPGLLHARRIQAKRLRYGVESLQGLLSKKRAAQWLHRATQAQTRIGAQRDLALALATARRLHGAMEILGFLRGALLCDRRVGAQKSATNGA